MLRTLAEDWFRLVALEFTILSSPYLITTLPLRFTRMDDGVFDFAVFTDAELLRTAGVLDAR